MSKSIWQFQASQLWWFADLYNLGQTKLKIEIGHWEHLLDIFVLLSLDFLYGLNTVYRNYFYNL